MGDKSQAQDEARKAAKQWIPDRDPGQWYFATGYLAALLKERGIK